MWGCGDVSPVAHLTFRNSTSGGPTHCPQKRYHTMASMNALALSVTGTKNPTFRPHKELCGVTPLLHSPCIYYLVCYLCHVCNFLISTIWEHVTVSPHLCWNPGRLLCLTLALILSQTLSRCLSISHSLSRTLINMLISLSHTLIRVRCWHRFQARF